MKMQGTSSSKKATPSKHPSTSYMVLQKKSSASPHEGSLKKPRRWDCCRISIGLISLVFLVAFVVTIVYVIFFTDLITHLKNKETTGKHNATEIFTTRFNKSTSHPDPRTPTASRSTTNLRTSSNSLSPTVHRTTFHSTSNSPTNPRTTFGSTSNSPTNPRTTFGSTSNSPTNPRTTDGSTSNSPTNPLTTDDSTSKAPTSVVPKDLNILVLVVDTRNHIMDNGSFKTTLDLWKKAEKFARGLVDDPDPKDHLTVMFCETCRSVGVKYEDDMPTVFYTIEHFRADTHTYNTVVFVALPTLPVEIISRLDRYGRTNALGEICTKGTWSTTGCDFNVPEPEPTGDKKVMHNFRIQLPTVMEVELLAYDKLVILQKNITTFKVLIDQPLALR